METNSLRPSMAIVLIAVMVILGGLIALTRVVFASNPIYWSVSGAGETQAPSGEVSLLGAEAQAAAVPVQAAAAVLPGGTNAVPTPDAPHPLPPMRQQAEQYVVQGGDTLGNIARRYSVSLSQLISANNITNPNLLEVGQLLLIPIPEPGVVGPDFKIIPDSELVFGPQARSLDIAAFVAEQGGLLASYMEEVDGVDRTGAQIVERVAWEYSINPRLLLAFLEYQSGWVTQASPNKVDPNYPAGLPEPRRPGLYRQLAWASDQLNAGYYQWRVNATSAWLLADGNVIPASPVINAGTAAVQQLFASLSDLSSWQTALSADGLFATYQAFFGYPFLLAVEPVIPEGLQQPQLQLPFEANTHWAFTGGPHGGWGDGSAWAALDFAPPGEALGCVPSDAWVAAAADGVIVRSSNGAVLQDLDGDGNEGTGWVVLYMHVEARDRVQPGTVLKAGERVGHPSCEGGVSSGTHLHLARRYNGEWISADGTQPFVLDGWVSAGQGSVYDGYLNRDGETIEAYAGRADFNGIGR